MSFHSGFVAILGRPNVGKSSIMNRFVGEKVAIVSDRPQTTRTKILGVATGDGWQTRINDTLRASLMLAGKLPATKPAEDRRRP